MAKSDVLKPEAQADREPYIPVRDDEVYVGDRVRIREIYAHAGLTKQARVDKRMREVQSYGERVLIADVSRVAVGKAGRCFFIGDIVEGHTSTTAYRVQHVIGSSRMKSKSVTKELCRHPDFGPSASERLAETPYDHSKRVRTERFHHLVQQAIAGGVSEALIWETLERVGDDYALNNHETAVAKARASGKPIPPRPDDMGDAELAAVRAVRSSGREPDYWMLPVVQSASDDAKAFILANEWRDAA